MITIRTPNFSVEGSVEDILSLFSQLELRATVEPVEEPPTVTVERDIEQTSLTAFEPFKQRRSGQLGMRKADYGTGRKVHSCSVCGEPHRRINPKTGRCKSCPSQEVAL